MARWFIAVFLIPSLAAAADLAGSWEIQSMGSDRKVDIQQRGDTLIAHRVMWPTFEGQKYKLEHLYRGKISGGKIQGELLVKEQEFPDYEILRKFDGKIASNDKITIDGIPMKRTGGASATTAPPAEPKPAPGPSDGAPPPPPPPPPTPEEPEEPEPPAGDNPGAGLFARIMSTPGMESLFEDALKVAIPEAVAELTAEGDASFAKGDYRGALAKFEEASNTGGGADPQLLHRTGRCLLKLKRWADAKQTLRSALKLDPGNKQIKRDYKKAKRKAR
jgi:tetratricopeptide (TPR) repeat protein